jgi:hypothetical protein
MSSCLAKIFCALRGPLANGSEILGYPLVNFLEGFEGFWKSSEKFIIGCVDKSGRGHWPLFEKRHIFVSKVIT